MCDHPVVTVSPAHRFGRPAIKGISCEAIAGMVMAGEDVGAVAADYGISRHEVLLACWHEATFGLQRTYRRGWRAWADRIAPKLAGLAPFDPATEPGPPDKHELSRPDSLMPDSSGEGAH
jgi:uncharacterized protein (DUF433 family)